MERKGIGQVSLAAEYPLLIPLAGIVVGLATVHLTGYLVPAPVPYIFAVVAGGSILLRRHYLFFCFLFLTCLAWGNRSLSYAVAPELNVQHIRHFIGEEPVLVEGVVVERPQKRDGTTTLVLAADHLSTGAGWQETEGRLLLHLQGESDAMTGDRLRFRGRLKEPRNYLLPGAPDRVRQLAYQRIFATASVADSRELIVLAPNSTLHLLHWFDQLAFKEGERIDQQLPGRDGEVLKGLLLGLRAGIDRDVTDAFSRSGVTHILSISGFHVGVVAITLFTILLAVGRLLPALLLGVNLRRWLPLVVLPLLVAYMLLAGAEPATLRSVLMAVALIFSLMIEREVEPINVLILAAVVILVASPADLFDPSFQLSFLALWGILLAVRWWGERISALKQALVRWFLLLELTTVAATAATFLPVSYFFHRANVTGLLSNVLVVPLLGFGAVIVGFAALIIDPLIPLFGTLLLAVAALIVRLSMALIDLLAQLPDLPAGNPGLLSLGMALLIITLLTLIREGRWRLLLLSCFFLLLLVVVVTPPPWQGKVTLTHLSVGQGDATFVTTTGGKTLLIDSGGSASGQDTDFGDRLLVPALRALGVRRLDLLILTHGHPDHAGGMAAVVKRFPVGELWHGAPLPNDIALAVDSRGVPHRAVDRSTPPVIFDDMTLHILSPPPEGGGAGESNEDSLVIRLHGAACTALFTGDIGISTEERLLTERVPLRASILKVAHHGSRGSSSTPFLAAVRPTVAVISVGANNPFGLPSPESESRLQQQGAHLLRTDRDGTITLLPTSQGILVETSVGSRYLIDTTDVSR